MAVEDRISRLALSIYRRSNRATHTKRGRGEVQRVLSYLNPILEDILEAARNKKEP